MMRIMRCLAITLMIGMSAQVVLGGSTGTIQNDEELTRLIADWNELVFTIAVAEDGLLTLKGLRTASLMHLAVHDALNAIDPRFEPFAFAKGAKGADAAAAILGASFDVVSSQYPDQSLRLRRKLDSELGRIDGGPGKRMGMELGVKCAAAVIGTRDGDGWDTKSEYAWSPMGPGVYAEFNEHSGTPEGFIFGAGWAKAKPFALSRSDQFRVPPPPEINSEEYLAAYREVKELGRFQSMTRTPDQTHLALWWKDFVENSHNRLARYLVAEEVLDAWSVARMFALLNMGVYDAYISSFDNKFHYNHWRPYTAIRWAANDGNPHTEPDTLWNNTHRHTYAFPSYPSAHGTASAAAMTILAETFGDDLAFTMRISEVDIAGPMSEKISMRPPIRSFKSFSEAAMECAMSRVYLGIHFLYDSTEGNRLGIQVGDHLVGNVLRPRE